MFLGFFCESLNKKAGKKQNANKRNNSDWLCQPWSANKWLFNEYRLSPQVDFWINQIIQWPRSLDQFGSFFLFNFPLFSFVGVRFWLWKWDWLMRVFGFWVLISTCLFEPHPNFWFQFVSSSFRNVLWTVLSCSVYRISRPPKRDSQASFSWWWGSYALSCSVYSLRSISLPSFWSFKLGMAESMHLIIKCITVSLFSTVRN